MHTRVRHVADRVVVELDGDADLASAPHLAQALARAIDQATDSGAQVVVDLDGALALDDTALGLLVGAAARARRAGASLSVVCSGERHRSRLSDTRLDQIIDVRSSTV